MHQDKLNMHKRDSLIDWIPINFPIRPHGLHCMAEGSNEYPVTNYPWFLAASPPEYFSQPVQAALA